MENIRSIGYSLHHLSFVLDRQSDQVLLSKFGIGFSQFKILMVLNGQADIQQKEIAACLGQTEASVSRQIKLLLEMGLVASRYDASNRRQRITSLTTKGASCISSALEALEMHFRPVFTSLTDKQIYDLDITLQKMHETACQDNNNCKY